MLGWFGCWGYRFYLEDSNFVKFDRLSFVSGQYMKEIFDVDVMINL